MMKTESTDKDEPTIRNTAAYGTPWIYCKNCGWNPTLRSCDHLEVGDVDGKGRRIIDAI